MGKSVYDNGVAFANNGDGNGNAGYLNVTSGTLSLYDMTLTNNSVINQTGSSTLQVSTGATLNNARAGDYVWSGGTLDVTSGIFTNSGTITIPNPDIDPSSYNLKLEGTLINNSVVKQSGPARSILISGPIWSTLRRELTRRATALFRSTDQSLWTAR